MNACNGCLFQAAQSSIKTNLLSSPTSIYHVKFKIQKLNSSYFCETGDFIKLLNGFLCDWEATELILGYLFFIVNQNIERMIQYKNRKIRCDRTSNHLKISTKRN